jgi:hypothetical protein
VKLQAQAVLRRTDGAAPLRLAGVLVAGSFYPATVQEAWGPLHLEVGLVALAPLTPVVADGEGEAAARALREALAQWSAPGTVDVRDLAWRPITEVRVVTADDEVRALIDQMSIANDARIASTPSTPPYHRAARELEHLAARVYEAANVNERAAEDAALRDKETANG